ncbi:Ig-like domain-containing protein, partial [Listeria booriae]
SNNATFTDIIRSEAADSLPNGANRLIDIDFVAKSDTTYIGLGNQSNNQGEYSNIRYFTPELQRINLGAPSINPLTTTDSSVTVGGEPNAVLTIVLPNGEEMSQVADSKGMATFDIPKQTVGSKVTATQATEGAVSDSASITVTQRAVVAPTINRLTTDDTTVTGTGIPGASVKVTLENGMEYTGIVKTDGTYSITIPKQAFNRLVGA